MAKVPNILLIPLIAVSLVLGACSTTNGTENGDTLLPIFRVTSINVSPKTVVTGETVNVTAVIENTGYAEGVYTAVLTVNGVDTEAKEVTVAPGNSRIATFSIVEKTPGTYKIGIDKLSATLKVEKNLIELSHDDGTSDGSCSSGEAYAFLVRFSPEVTPFVIDSVSIYATLKGSNYEDQKPAIEIWDQDFNMLYRQEESVDAFSIFPGWVTIDLPDLTVNSDFYVVFYTNSANYGGIYLNYDLSSPNDNSDMAAGGKIAGWIWGHISRDHTNWMIRVIGTTGLK